MSKSFSYAHLTKTVEEEIASWATVAAKARAEGNSYGVARAFRYMAEGAVSMWNRTTMGWQKDGDIERLEALARAVDPSSVDNE